MRLEKPRQMHQRILRTLIAESQQDHARVRGDRKPEHVPEVPIVRDNNPVSTLREANDLFVRFLRVTDVQNVHNVITGIAKTPADGFRDILIEQKLHGRAKITSSRFTVFAA